MQVKFSKKNVLGFAACLVLVVLAMLLFSGAVRTAFAPLFNSNIDRQNLQFLHDARTQSFDNILVFGEILAALEIVQSAEVGFSFIGSASVQVGQALAGLNYALERALAASIAGAGLYEALIILAGLASLLNVFFFQLVLFASAARLFCSSLPASNPIFIASRLALRGTLAVFVASYVLLPYSINITGWLASTVPFGMAQQHSERLQDYHSHVVADKPAAREFTYWTKEQAVRGQYKKFEEGLPHTVEQTTRHAISIALHALFVGLLLPLCIFGLSWWALRRFMGEHKAVWEKIEQAAIAARNTVT